MPTGEVGQCKHGERIGDCLREHVRKLIPPARPRSGQDRDCPTCHKPLSVNIGTKGMRFVWHCPTQCDPAPVRRAFTDTYQVDETCLGSYGKQPAASKPRDQHRAADRVAPSTLAAERRWYVIEKLAAREFDSVALLKVCIQAVKESDGNVSPDPEHLLPLDYRELAALARRAGIERCYSYKFARWWLKQMGAVTS